MSSSDHNLDARMRDVPLPEGLLARLRALAVADDEGLDAGVREVPVPEGLLQSLRAIPLADDQGLDAALQDVAVPSGLLKSLKTIPLADDEGLDAALRDVPMPVRVGASWHRRGRRLDRLARVSRMALAASILVAVSLVFFSAGLVTLVMQRWPDMLASKEKGPVEPDTSAPLADQPLEKSLAVEPLRSRGVELPLPEPPAIELAQVEPSRRPATSDLAGGMNLPATDDPLLPHAPDLLGQRLLGSSFDELPELSKQVSDLVPRGLSWPLVPGANNAALWRYGVHPFVSPAANAQLKKCVVPLGVGTSSYELTRRYLESKELPPPDVVRTEEFIAALDTGHPRPKNQDLAVTLYAGPSPLHEGYHLVEVGVQARDVVEPGRAPSHLVLLVDTSASMRWGSRVEILRRALHDHIQGLRPDDRVSIISFARAAHVLVQDLGPTDSAPLMAAIDSLRGEGSTDVASGLREAYSLAKQTSGAGRPAVRVVLVTDGLVELDDAWMARIEQQVSEAAASGMRLDVIDLGQQQKRDSSQVAAIARAGQGTVHRATTTPQVGWAMREIVSGQSQRVAREARLQVAFNPAVVLEYRLLGHEAKDWAGMLPGPAEADFRSGQSTSALFEVRLAPGAAGRLATAELSWYSSAAGGALHQAAASIDRKDIAMSWSATPPSLQAAALAAQTAEILRRSPYAIARGPRSSIAAALVKVSELAGMVDSQAYQRTSFLEFVTLVDQAIKARPARNGVARP